MSGAGFNGNEALCSRVLMDVEALGELESASDFERLFCDCILIPMSGAGFNGIEALRSRVLMDVKALGQKFRKVAL